MVRFAAADAPTRGPVREAVLDLLARAAPRPAALGAPSAEEREFLETLRRIVARTSAQELWDKYHSPLPDLSSRILAGCEE